MLHQPHHTVGTHEVHVWHLLTDPLADSPALGAIPRLLSPEEQARLERIAKNRDRTLYAWSRILMRSVLASYLDCPCLEVRFTASPFGKPILNESAPPVLFNL